MMLNIYYRQEHYHPIFALRGTLGMLAFRNAAELRGIKPALSHKINYLIPPDFAVTQNKMNVSLFMIIFLIMIIGNRLRHD